LYHTVYDEISNLSIFLELLLVFEQLEYFAQLY